MVKTRIIFQKLARNFPKKIAKKYDDFVGIMHGTLKKDTQKILLCLDFDDEVLRIAEKMQPDLIITHHPFIYGRKQQVLKRDEYRRNLCSELDKLDIPVYSMHTNFDEGIGGMNDALAQQIGLQNITILDNEPLARAGELAKACPIEEAARMIKERLGVNYAILSAYGPQMIKRIAIIGGGGASHYQNVFKENIDLFVSGDAPHYLRRAMVAAKVNYLDIPHEVERIFMETLKKHLLKIDASLEIVCVDHELDPKVI